MECRSLREYKKKKELGTKREKTKEGTEERKRSPFFSSREELACRSQRPVVYAVCVK